MSCIEGKRGLKTLTVVHKMLRYLLIYRKISFVIQLILSAVMSDIRTIIFFNKFHKYIHAKNKFKYLCLQPVNIQKYIDGGNRIITHLTEIMQKNEIIVHI